MRNERKMIDVVILFLPSILLISKPKKTLKPKIMNFKREEQKLYRD